LLRSTWSMMQQATETDARIALADTAGMFYVIRGEP
jgi:hypothetical protein